MDSIKIYRLRKKPINLSPFSNLCYTKEKCKGAICMLLFEKAGIENTQKALEIAMMALDASTIECGKPVIAVGGSGRGAGTVCRLTPAYTSDLMGTRIHEFLCKPALEE